MTEIQLFFSNSSELGCRPIPPSFPVRSIQMLHPKILKGGVVGYAHVRHGHTTTNCEWHSVVLVEVLAHRVDDFLRLRRVLHCPFTIMSRIWSHATLPPLHRFLRRLSRAEQDLTHRDESVYLCVDMYMYVCVRECVHVLS
jgi:hypothetical protein